MTTCHRCTLGSACWWASEVQRPSVVLLPLDRTRLAVHVTSFYAKLTRSWLISIFCSVSWQKNQISQNVKLSFYISASASVRLCRDRVSHANRLPMTALTYRRSAFTAPNTFPPSPAQLHSDWRLRLCYDWLALIVWMCDGSVLTQTTFLNRSEQKNKRRTKNLNLNCR